MTSAEIADGVEIYGYIIEGKAEDHILPQGEAHRLSRDVSRRMEFLKNR